ncbi:hypothetical protein DMA11_08190 [Marinilabiliaceae bacterium JC017]|nr:hypothetical protein DMA11_08190 [Marinilabiliaceae bacterium JC017]
MIEILAKGMEKTCLSRTIWTNDRICNSNDQGNPGIFNGKRCWQQLLDYYLCTNFSKDEN